MTSQFPLFPWKDADWDLIPEHMREGLYLYICNGIEPGGFLGAVLCNDLNLACQCADSINQRALFNYVKFLHNWAPKNCWGSPDDYYIWRRIGGLGIRISPSSGGDASLPLSSPDSLASEDQPVLAELPNPPEP